MWGSFASCRQLTLERSPAFLYCAPSGRFHAAGGGVAAGPRPGGLAPAGERHQGESPPAGAAHRRAQGRHQGRRLAPAERPQRRRGVQGTSSGTATR